MIFDYKDYYSATFTLPALEFGVATILLIIFIIKISKTPSNTPKITISNVLSIVICILFIISSTTSLRYGIYLVKEKENNYTTITGEIENIENVINSPRYYYNDKVVRAKIVTIDGNKLYFKTIGNLKAGDIVEVEYLPKSTFVIKVKLLSDS